MNLRLVLMAIAACSLWACSQGAEEKKAAGTAGGTKVAEKAPEAAPVDDGRTYVLPPPRRWQVGDVVTNTETARETPQVKRIMSDGLATPMPASEKRTDAIWLEQTQAIDDDGGRSRYLVWIRSWSHQEGERSDDSITGVYVQVSDAGPTRTWSLVDPSVTPSEVARKWLDETFGSSRLGVEETDRMIRHAGSVAVGASWQPDTAPWIAWAAARSFEVGPQGVTVTAKLVGVAGNEGHVSFEASLPLLSMPETKTPWTKGGTVVLTGDLRFPMDGKQIDFHLDRHVALDGVTTMDGSKIHLTVQADDTLERATGGTFVAPAGAPAAP